MINIKKDYKHLSKNVVRHYYLCKRMFGDMKPIVVPSIKEIEETADKELAAYWENLEKNPLTLEELDKSIEDQNKRENGTLFWPNIEEY